MNFVKGQNRSQVIIPQAALALAGMEGNEQLQLRVTNSAIVILKSEMTAMELIYALRSMEEVWNVLMRSLREVCGDCENCGDCAWDPDYNGSVEIPAEVLKEAGIAESAKLCAEADPANGKVIVTVSDAKNNLDDVPSELLHYLGADGVCLGKLEELLMSGEVISCDD